MPGRSGRVFVCHSSLDADLARQLVTVMEGTGVRCWIAPRDVESGVPYPRQLVHAISDCGVFLLLITSHSASSDHVLRELEQAVKRRRPILPVVVDCAMSDDLDYYVGAIHQIHGATPEEVVGHVAAYFNTPDGPQPRPAPSMPTATGALSPALHAMSSPVSPPPTKRTNNTLTVGVIPWPPFADHPGADGRCTGLFVELLQSYGSEANVDVNFRAITNEQSARLLNEGAIDLVACLYRTPRRERVFDFAACLYAATMGAVVRASDDRIASFGDLMRDEIKIVACQGEIGAELACDQFGAEPGSSRLVEMDTVNVRHIGVMVAAGAADVAITDSITCQLIVDEIGPVLKPAFPQFPLFVGQIGLLMASGREELRDHLSSELRRLRSNQDFQRRETAALAPFRGMLQIL